MGAESSDRTGSFTKPEDDTDRPRARVVVASRRSSPDALSKTYEGYAIVDVTSRGAEPWVRFSPFFPHGDIPVPFSGDWVGASVEGIWQGLKVFEREDIDVSKFDVRSMRRLKRSSRTLGKVLGHRRGVSGTDLLPYGEARTQIYVPTYKHVLRTHLPQLLQELRETAKAQGLLLLDYETNTDITELRRPLSHAGLVCDEILAGMPPRR